MRQSKIGRIVASISVFTLLLTTVFAGAIQQSIQSIHAQPNPTQFTVRIENISNHSALPGPLSPGVWAIHTQPAPLFTVGEADRGQGLAAIAEDGNPAQLADALPGQPGIQSSGVFNTPSGGTQPGPALPGDAYEFTFSAVPGDNLSLATMLVQSNDIFAAPGEAGIPLFDASGNPLPARDITAALPFWDAGTEVNEAPGMGPNQAPRQPGPNTGAAEGVVDFFRNSTRALPLPAGIVDVNVSETDGTFTISIENVSAERGAITTPLSPVFYATHNANWQLFSVGEPASPNGLEALAEDGDAGPLVTAVTGATGTGMVGAATTPVGGSPGPAAPGQRYEFSVTPTSAYPYLTIATMIVESNDAFLAFDAMGLALLNARGVPRSSADIAADIRRELAVWDAGTEVNEVPGAGPYQPLRQAAPNSGPVDPDSSVRRYADATNDLAGSGLGGFAEVDIAYVPGTTPPQFNVTLRNTSGSTAYNGGLTPVVWAVHTEDISLFEIGEPASPQLERLAEDGATQLLLDLLSTAPQVSSAGVVSQPDGATDAGPIFDGQTYSFTITVPDGDFRYLSIGSMVIPSNDTFLAFFPSGVSLVHAADGTPRTQTDIDEQIVQQLVAWDAGTERNQAGAAGPDQAPRQSGPDTGANEGDGTVRILDEANPDPVWHYPPITDVLRATLIPMVTSTGPGAVFTATNGADGNAVVMYDRAEDGRITYIGTYATGGRGVGPGLTAAVDPLGSQNSLIVHQDWLFVVNAGSNEISSFRISRDGLELVDRVASGGNFPVSLTAYGNWLYVLNVGGEGNISGFRIGEDGKLTALPNSTRTLDTGNTDPPDTIVAPSQIGFSPNGEQLVITNGGANAIHIFVVDDNGLAAPQPVTTPTAGNLPFSFVFTPDGELIVPEAPGSAVSSYRVNADHTLSVISASVANGQGASCWIVGVGDYVYVSNTATHNVSSYRVGPGGNLTLLEGVAFDSAVGAFPTDMAVIGNYLYILNPGIGTMNSYVIDPDDGSVESLRNAVNVLGTIPGAQGLATYTFPTTQAPGQSVYLPLILR